MSTQTGDGNIALGPLQDLHRDAQDLEFRPDDIDCDELYLGIAAAAQHGREVARDTLEGETGSPFYAENEEAFLGLVANVLELHDRLLDMGDCERQVMQGVIDRQLGVFREGFQSGSVPLATGGLDNIAEWAKQNMSPEMREELDEAAGLEGEGGPRTVTLETDREFLEQANSLISALNQENECPALFDLADSVMEMVEQYADAAVQGTVDIEKEGGGTAPAEVSNAWIIMYRRLSDNGCISEDAKDALRDINPVEDIRNRQTQDVETDVQTARFIIGVEEGSAEGQKVTCARVDSGQDIRKSLLEAASQGSIQAATIGEHDRGGQVLCAVLTDQMED